METPKGKLEFQFFIGDFGGLITTLETFQGKLYYGRDVLVFKDQLAPEYAEQIDVNTTALYQALQPVLEWNSRYVDLDLIDGTHWTLLIEMNDQKKEIYGANQYPENFYKVIRILKRVIKKPLP